MPSPLARALIGAAALAASLIPVSTAFADARDFTLINGSSETVAFVHVSEASAATWGPDILGTGVLLAGEQADVTFTGGPDSCTYDIKIVDLAGREAVIFDLDLCSTFTVTYRD